MFEEEAKSGRRIPPGIRRELGGEVKRITCVGRPGEMTIKNETHSTAFFIAIAIRDRDRSDV